MITTLTPCLSNPVSGIQQLLFSWPCEDIAERGGTRRWVQPWEGGKCLIDSPLTPSLSSCAQKSDQMREAGLEEGFKVESPPPGSWAPRVSASQHLMLPGENRRRFHRMSGPWSLGLWSRWRRRSTVKIRWRWRTRTPHRAPVKAQERQRE